MKKVILSLAILVASSASMFAANDNKTESHAPACKTQTTCTVNGSCNKERPKCDRDAKAFEGLGLTAEQQSKLAELRKNCTRDRVECCKSGKQKLTDEQKKQLKAERRAKHTEARKKYLEDVKSILTPEQYSKFLENSYLSQGHKHKSGKGHGKRVHHMNGSRNMDRKA